MTQTVCIIGRGRVGRAIAAALDGAGVSVVGPLGRGERAPHEVDVVLLAVPDAAIASASGCVPSGPIVGHCSASAPLDLLGRRDAFSLHPLLPLTGDEITLAGGACAIGSNAPEAQAAAEWLATMLGMRIARVHDEDRALYHAAASLAANYLVTLEGEAERLMASVGVERALLAPLVRAALDNWADKGARAALTGPIVRGDDATVARQREAIAARAPELLPMWDAITARTRVLAEHA